MYARQPPDGRMPRTMRLPRNYSGNAFPREETAFTAEEATTPPPPAAPTPPPSDPPSAASPSLSEATDRAEEAVPTGKTASSPGFRLDPGKLFGKNGAFGIGMEELLILGLIFLVSQSDRQDDLALLLLILLFIQ